MACIFYAPLIPLALPIACGGSILTYLSYKYMLLRVHKMPEMFGDLMATFFASLMPLILIVWAFSYQIFVKEINRAYQPRFNEMYNCDLENFENCDGDSSTVLNKTSLDYGWTNKDDLTQDDKSAENAETALYLTIVAAILPIRSFLHCMKKEVEEEENTKYSKMALNFTEDYDKENPLTVSDYKKRLLDLQIDQAKASGN